MSFGASEGSSTSYSGQRIAPNQLPHLQNLWQLATGLSEGAVAGAQDTAGELAGGLLPGLQQTFGNMTALSDPSQEIAAQSQSLQQGLGQLFREQINPTISAGAVAAGGSPGGRQGVAQGVAAGQLAQAYEQGLGNIVSNARRTSLGAAGLAPQLASQIMSTGQAPNLAGFDPLTRLAAIIGSPSIIGHSVGSSSQSGFNFGLG